MSVCVCLCVAVAIHSVLLFVCHLILHSIAKRNPYHWFHSIAIYFALNARLNCWSTTQFSIAISRIQFVLMRFSFLSYTRFYVYIYSFHLFVFFAGLSIVIWSFFCGQRFPIIWFWYVLFIASHRITLQNYSLIFAFLFFALRCLGLPCFRCGSLLLFLCLIVCASVFIIWLIVISLLLFGILSSHRFYGHTSILIYCTLTGFCNTLHWLPNTCLWDLDCVRTDVFFFVRFFFKWHWFLLLMPWDTLYVIRFSRACLNVCWVFLVVVRFLFLILARFLSCECQCVCVCLCLLCSKIFVYD